MSSGRGPNALSSPKRSTSPPLLDLNCVDVGDSVTAGTGNTFPWPELQQNSLANSVSVAVTVTNLGHPSYSLSGINGSSSLLALIPSEVDPLWTAGKENILTIECINDPYFGATKS